MAEIHPPQPVKLICGLLAGAAARLDAAETALVERFGPVDCRSDDMAFDFTEYYRRQMGPGLIRRFVGFAELIDPGALASIKRATTEIELDLAGRFPSAEAPRPVNLDPGYVAPSKLVLASAKNFAHRIYLDGGIYAEITLQYRAGRWRALGWTFPDYASGRYDAFLDAARESLRRRQKEPDAR